MIRARTGLSPAVFLSTVLFACTAPAQPFVASDAGVVSSRQSTPTDTTFVLEDGRQLTFRPPEVQWLNGMAGEGDLLIAGTTPTPWAATASSIAEGPGGMRPCYSVSGKAWDRGAYVEIDVGTSKGSVTLRVAKGPSWTSSAIPGLGLQMGTYTCLDATGRAVASGWTGN